MDVIGELLKSKSINLYAELWAVAAQIIFLIGLYQVIQNGFSAKQGGGNVLAGKLCAFNNRRRIYQPQTVVGVVFNDRIFQGDGGLQNINGRGKIGVGLVAGARTGIRNIHMLQIGIGAGDGKTQPKPPAGRNI